MTPTSLRHGVARWFARWFAPRFDPRFTSPTSLTTRFPRCGAASRLCARFEISTCPGDLP
jgi:hypothetical protein